MFIFLVTLLLRCNQHGWTKILDTATTKDESGVRVRTMKLLSYTRNSKCSTLHITVQSDGASGNSPLSKKKFVFPPPLHAQLAGEWDLSHRDPLDRMLAAQAKLEKVTLATVDKDLLDFPIVFSL